MKKLNSLLIFVIFLAAFTSCKKAATVEDDQAYSYVTAVNAAASTSGSTINVAVGNQSMNDIPFAGTSSYKQLPFGDYMITVDYAGNSSTNAAYFVRGQAYSIFAIDDPSGMKAVAVEDHLPGNTTGITNIRFLQFSSDAPPMDIVIGGNIVFANRNYNDQVENPSFAAFTTIIPGTYDIEVRDPATSNVLYTFYSVTIDQGKTYNMIAKGSINGTNDQGFGITLVATN